jgi:DNA-binding XRE family transcriptional regulator
MNASIQAFYNVENPDVGPEWSLRIQLQALFPKSR